ncbi:transglutaminase-like cysteine peptidase [uncultured Alsobacter sp.]|uniref:transglutaminase-like cysteine peptidase n=1 Tax=uncultured Alsobacter sp. TaxID=1748258 RepID=UPI0025CFAE50|nr:transglutaminase-like cysteine peptidase [uncultured Alsobacter sp.]
MRVQDRTRPRRLLPFLAAAIAVALGAPDARAVDGPHLTTVGPAQSPPGSTRLCRDVAGACGRRPVGTSLAPDAERELAAEINTAVNRRMMPRIDPQGIGASWVPPPGSVGDCKHYAVSKKAELVRAGVDPRHLLLAIVARADAELHAVLVYRTAAGDVVLDSLTNRILGWRESGYTFIKMQAPSDPSRWALVLEGPRARRS